MRCLKLSTEVWVGSDQSCMLIPPLGRLGVSGRMRVFLHSHISLLLAGLSSSRLQFPTPTIICWFYLTKGLKACRTVITMIVRVACPLAREVPAGLGQTAVPTLTASARDPHPRPAESKCKGTWPECHGHGQKSPGGAWRDLVPFETWGPAEEGCLSISPITLSTNTA